MPAAMNAMEHHPDLRRLILDTTRRMLTEVGFRNLSMRRIAREIGYSATTIYLHFESKQELVYALIDEGAQRLFDLTVEAGRPHAAAPRTRLEKACQTYIEFGLANPEYYEIMYLLHPDQMGRYPTDKYRRARRNILYLRDCLVQLEQEGRLTLTDPLASATAVWASLHGTVSLILARRVDKSVDIDVLIRASIQSILAQSPSLHR